MKIALVVGFAVSAAMVSAGTPATNTLPEIPAKYCGTFYLHGEIGSDGKMEEFSPAKPFGRIEANKIMLDDGKLLKVTTIKQGEMVSRVTGKPTQVILISFEKTDFRWSISEMYDSVLAIMQLAVPQKPQCAMFIVSRSETNQPPPLPLKRKRQTGDYQY